MIVICFKYVWTTEVDNLAYGSWISRIALEDIWAWLSLSAFETPEDRDGLTMRATMHKIYLFDPGNKQVLIKFSMVPFPMPKNTYAHPGALPFEKLSSLIYPADSKNLSAERLFGAIPYTNLRTQNQRPSLKYFTKVLLVLFPKINSNLRPSRRLPTKLTSF